MGIAIFPAYRHHATDGISVFMVHGDHHRSSCALPEQYDIFHGVLRYPLFEAMYFVEVRFIGFPSHRNQFYGNISIAPPPQCPRPKGVIFITEARNIHDMDGLRCRKFFERQSGHFCMIPDFHHIYKISRPLCDKNHTPHFPKLLRYLHEFSTYTLTCRQSASWRARSACTHCASSLNCG